MVACADRASSFRVVPDVFRQGVGDHELSGRRCPMAGVSAPADMRELAEEHAREAERLLRSRLLSSHVKAQVHATLAAYYWARLSKP